VARRSAVVVRVGAGALGLWSAGGPGASQTTPDPVPHTPIPPQSWKPTRSTSSERCGGPPAQRPPAQRTPAQRTPAQRPAVASPHAHGLDRSLVASVGSIWRSWQFGVPGKARRRPSSERCLDGRGSGLGRPSGPTTVPSVRFDPRLAVVPSPCCSWQLCSPPGCRSQERPCATSWTASRSVVPWASYRAARDRSRSRETTAAGSSFRYVTRRDMDSPRTTVASSPWTILGPRPSL